MDKQDALTPNKTIYEASSGEIFWKNFLAGFARGLGGMFVYLLLLVVIYVLFVNFVLPRLMPYFVMINNLTKSLESLQKLNPSSGFTLPNNLNFQNLFGK